MTRVFAEYESATRLVEVVRSLRERGFDRLEAYSPYPIDGVDEALGAKTSGLPVAVFVFGFGCAGLAYALQWLLNAYLYPLNVGARPPHFPLSFVPITFEMGILFASFAAFFGVLAMGRLVRLYQRVFEVEGFRSATEDGYWVEVQSVDCAGAITLLRELGGSHVQVLGGES